MEKTSRDLPNIKSQSFIRLGPPSSAPTDGLGKAQDHPTLRAPAEAEQLKWSPSELVAFLRDLSALSEIELVFLLSQDTARSTRLLRMALRVSFPEEGSITTAIIQKVLSSIHQLDKNLNQAADLEARRRLYEVVVDLMEWCIKHKAPVSTDLWKYNLMALKALANIYQRQNATGRARMMLEKAVQYELKVSSKDQVLSVTATFNDLANLCVQLQDSDAAIHQYQRALQFQQETLEVDHPLIIATLQNMAHMYLRCHMYQDTLSLFHHILILQDARGINLLETASTLSSMGLLYYILKDYTNALHNYHEALTMLLRHYGGDCGFQLVNHFDIAMTLNSIGMIHCEVGNHEEARSTFQRCLDMHRALEAQASDASLCNQNAVSAVLYNLAVVYMQKGEDAIALGLFRQSIQMKKVIFEQGGCPEEMAGNLQKLGKIHTKRGEHEVAILYLEQANDMMPQAVLDDHMILLASLHLKTGNIQQMMSYLVEASRRTGSLDEVYQAFYQTGPSMIDAYCLRRIQPPSAGAA